MKITGYPSNKWFFAIDRGGTFTDVIGIDPAAHVHTSKLLSQSPHYPDPAIEGIRRMLHLSSEDPIPEDLVGGIRMGTTVATNALLQRQGAPIALFVTNGFRDLLEIGYQNRPELFKLAVRKPEQLYRCVREVHERIDHAGNIIKPIDLRAVKQELSSIMGMGIRSIAIVLMHAWKNNIHEQAVGDLSRELGFEQVSVSHEVMPLIKIVGRAQTTVVDAYLSPILKRYVDSVRKFTGNVPLEFMQSSGGITDADVFTGKDAIISGPAGGVIGTAAVARLNGMKESIGIDMGGTSTDVCRFGGTFEKVIEIETAGVRFQAPSLNVNTVAAGGGSILWFDGQKLRVGPRSASADPGPACYGKGGPLALTDANLLLGRILPAHFPSTFGKTGDRPLDEEIVKQKFRKLTTAINDKLHVNFSPIEVAHGFVKIADETMAKPIKEISVARGFDVRQHALVCFGGAAPQHACAIARILGIRKIIIHPLAGLLSAYGIAMADHLRYATQSLVEILKPSLYRRLDNKFKKLEIPLMTELLQRNVAEENIEILRYLDIRPLGTDSYLSIPFSGLDDILPTFNRSYQRRFGFEPSGVPLELVNIRVEALGKGGVFQETEASERSSRRVPEPLEMTDVYFGGLAMSTPVYQREDLVPGARLDGPAIVVEKFSTVVVEPSFSATVNLYGHLILEQQKAKQEIIGATRDPVMLEVFNHLFMSVAEQMGYTLQNTAHSTNIKERLDFSCAIFDPDGNLVANAPHIPVHLGAMGESVKSIVRDNRETMRPGDVYVTNNPHRGGSHLPDVTVISPVFHQKSFDRRQRVPIFFVASRGHHTDIGGITPGSMPPFATTLKQEGVVIDNFLLVSNGKFRQRKLQDLLLSGPYPARNLDERISDMKAQIAANNTGVKELERLVDKYSLETVHAYMRHIRNNAAEAMRDAFGKFLLDSEVFESHFKDHLDDGSSIVVSLRIGKGDNPPLSYQAVIDFSGTSPQTSGNLNAPIAVVKAAVLYILRTLIDEDIPLNSGCLSPMKIIIPEGCLLNPSPDAAVVGGNVETSQRVVDVLLGALGIAAASQGTMNNFLFGQQDGKGKQYYETIAGGSGATDGHPGASAVQVHMTNTRITDPEVLERRYPEIRLERFAIRRGSGGTGKYRGGDGAIREIRFLEPRNVSILSERRVYPPYGLMGGKAGAKGENILIKKDGTQRTLGGKAQLVVQAGEKIIIKTPGGGGFGKA